MDASSASIKEQGKLLSNITTKKVSKNEMLVTYNSDVSFRRLTVLPDYILDQNIAKRAKVDASGGWYNLKDIFGISDVFERAVYYNNLSKEIIIHKLNTLYCCVLTLHQLYFLAI